MAGKRSPTVTDRELLRRVLSEIQRRGEVMESDLYEQVGARNRIPPLLEHLCEHGILKKRRRETGHRVEMFSLTEKGELAYMSNRFTEEILESTGEIDMESGAIAEIRDNLRAHFNTDFES